MYQLLPEESPLSSLSDALEDMEEFMSVFSVLYPSAQSHQQLIYLLRQYEVSEFMIMR